jgi:serine/threonine protein kinase/tetratricopeptide (TPR) repeat protein
LVNASTASLTEAVGTRIGPYKLLQKLGEGGMGVVWVAEQTEPVKRRVALKVIKPGMSSAQVLRRFEAERQALALMDHPHIARVLDAGEAPPAHAGGSPRPYFVMELVKGVPITRYCDELHLPIKERLALFVPVCQAIQHAHQKGVIHRDVKPSNVLVCMQDGNPVAKVIDFGVAKALHQKLSEQSLFTEIGQIIGTLEYMSPEQAELSALDIDTRVDVYALGVLLYELLTGSTPLEKKRLRSATMLELLRIIREEEPPRPSTRLTDSKEALTSLAVQRRTDPGRLAKEVRGELDWIVMKCLEKDRTRRYETASALARDVERHLRDETVDACPPRAGYRLKKLLRRNRGPVMAAAALLLVVLAGTAVSTWQAVRAGRAEAEARQKRDEAEAARQAEAEQKKTAVANEHRAKAAAEAAEVEKKTAQAVRDFLLNDLLRQADPEAQANRLLALDEEDFEVQENPTIKELLERAAAGLTPERIEQKFPRQPRLQAEILSTIGQAYFGIGEYGRAIAHFQRAADLWRAHRGQDHLRTLHRLAEAYHRAGKNAEAIALLEKVRDASISRLGPNHHFTLAILNALAVASMAAGKNAAAIALLEKVRDAHIARFGLDHLRTLNTLHNLAAAYQRAGKTAEAIALNEKVLAGRVANLGSDHPRTLITLHNLALAYQRAGKTAEAIARYEKVRDAQIAQFGPNHPRTLSTLLNLASAYRAAGKTAEALAMLEELLPRVRRAFGVSHPRTIASTNRLIVALEEASRFARAAEVRGELLAVQRKQLPADALRLASALGLYGRALLKSGRAADAEPILRECLAIREKKQPDAWATFNTRSLLGGSLLGQKKYAEAEPLLRAGYEGLKERETKIPRRGRFRLSEALQRLVQLCDATGKKDEAARWRKKLEERKAQTQEAAKK